MAAGLLGNRVTERDVRNWLDANGFYGRSAKISDLELHAIKRPGWRQVFRFCADAKTCVQGSDAIADSDDSETRQTLYGVVLDDQRQRDDETRTQIRIFYSVEERDKQLDAWSADMLTCSTEHSNDLTILVTLVIAFILIAVVLGTWVG
jgi:hypothetical protein